MSEVENKEFFSLLEILKNNEIVIKDKVLNENEKELINKIIEKMFEMNWKQEDKRIEMLFELSLIIDKLKSME